MAHRCQPPNSAAPPASRAAPFGHLHLHPPARHGVERRGQSDAAGPFRAKRHDRLQHPRDADTAITVNPASQTVTSVPSQPHLRRCSLVVSATAEFGLAGELHGRPANAPWSTTALERDDYHYGRQAPARLIASQGGNANWLAARVSSNPSAASKRRRIPRCSPPATLPWRVKSWCCRRR